MAVDRASVAFRVGVVGVAGNLVVAAFKAAAGLAAGSHALVADAVESLTDLGTTAGLLVALRLGERPPDPEHPYGHRRFESELTRLVALLLMATGALIGWQSLRSLGRSQPVGWAAPVAALVSVVAKEWMYRYTLVQARRLGSPALVASAWHHRSDALTSVATLAAVVGAAWGWPWLDPVAGVAVAAVIVVVSARLYWRATRELVDTAPPPWVMERLLQAARATPGVVEVDQLRARMHASRVLADVTIRVHPELPVQRGHAIAENVERSLRAALPELVDVMVHVEPAATPAARASGPSRRSPAGA
ncbi:MAG TPA: cation diffusion facilitator family transporter [Limnochordales bacterium]